MGGVVKVFVESNTGELVERRMAQVQRVVLRQLQSEQELSVSASPGTAIVRRLEDNEQLAKVELSYGGFPNTIQRQTVDADLLHFEFPFGPKEVQYAEHALQYQEIKRPGMKPLLRARAPKNRTVSLSAIIADRSSRGLGSCENQLQKLKDMAETDLDLEFRHGYVTFPARLRITSMNISSKERALTGEITKATVRLTLKEILPLNIDIVSLAAILEEPKKIATIPSGEAETEPEAATAEEAAQFDSTNMQFYTERRPDLNTADFALFKWLEG